MNFVSTPIEKRVIPKQRAIFIAAARLKGNIAKQLVKAFLAMQGDIPMDSLVRIIRSASHDEIFELMNASGIEAITSGLAEELNAGVSTGGSLAAKELKKVAVLDLTRPRVAKWVAEHSTELITNIGKNSREAIKHVLGEGINRGRHPLRMAKDLKRSLGLNDRLAKAVMNRRLSLEKADMPLTKVDKIVKKYSEKLLKYRAELIARTESMTAINQGRLDLWKQLEEDEAFPDPMEQEWLTSADERVCPICGPMNGQRRAIGESFEGSEGSVDAPPIHAQCRCSVVLVKK
jgi:SPP1 gp7 family putative phage head morphogenesis protein